MRSELSRLRCQPDDIRGSPHRTDAYVRPQWIYGNADTRLLWAAIVWDPRSGDHARARERCEPTRLAAKGSAERRERPSSDAGTDHYITHTRRAHRADTLRDDNSPAGDRRQLRRPGGF